jgi:hypothetical protein
VDVEEDEDVFFFLALGIGFVLGMVAGVIGVLAYAYYSADFIDDAGN